MKNTKDKKGEVKMYTDTPISDLSDVFIKNKKGELYQFVLESIERPLIEKVLERTYGNQYRAAKILGINRNTLHSKIKKLNIDLEKFKTI